MIKIRCRSNIDCVRNLKWPDYLPARPAIGDLIRSESSTKNKYIELEVHRCTWYKDSYSNEWILEVELHLVKTRFANVPDFEKFVLKSSW